jgi:hypothetical protein
MSGEALALVQVRNVSRPAEIDPGLLKSPVVFCVGNVVRELQKHLPRSIQVWRLVGIEHSLLTVELAENQLRTLTRPPLMTVALVATDRDGLAVAANCAAWLRDHGVRAVPDAVAATSETMAELTACLAGQLVETMAAQAELITSLSRELASFRIGNENLQNHFNAVEAVLARKGLQPYDLDFVNEPVDDRPNVIEEATQGRIAQILPVGSAGVSAFGIHIATDIPATAAGSLKAQVTTLEDGIVVDTWGVPVAALRAGWNVFGFARSLSGLPRTLELTLSVTGGNSALPCLSLGTPQPIERFRVHDADNRQALADASLALQVWTGLAAVALPSWATFWSSQPRPGGGTDVPLRQESVAPDILGFVALHNGDEVEFDFEAVRALIPERAVACHPPAAGMTVARLPGACPAGAIRVSAYGLIDNVKSRDVEFALVTTLDGARARPLLSGEALPAAGECVSDWIRVSPSAKKAVNAFIAEPIARWQDIFIATRMAEAGNNDFAWAKVQDLTAVFQDLA